MKPLLAALALCAAAPSHALTVTGWFQGTVINGDVTPVNVPPPYPLEYFLGAPATGHFTIEIDDDAASQQPFGRFVPVPGTLDVGVTVRGVDFAYTTIPGSGEPGIWAPDASGRNLDLWSNYRPRFHGFILGFQSDDASLLAGPTPADYRLDTTTVSDISFYFASAEVSAWFDVGVTAFGFGTLAAPVPEPSTALLLALGVAALAGHQRRKDRTASRSVAS